VSDILPYGHGLPAADAFEKAAVASCGDGRVPAFAPGAAGIENGPAALSPAQITGLENEAMDSLCLVLPDDVWSVLQLVLAHDGGVSSAMARMVVARAEQIGLPALLKIKSAGGAS
jgi:hypothetical protein